MRFKAVKTVAVAATAAGLLAGMTGVASALPAFKGAGYTIKAVEKMTVTWTIPTLACTANEPTDAVVLGMMGPAVGTAAGWNAASVSGCYQGHAWYRIQTWVNALGGGHAVADAQPGDVVQARLVNGHSSRPTLTVTDLTHPSFATYKLLSPTTVASPGAYAGANVPNFGSATFKVSANNYTPMAKLSPTRHVQMKGSVKQIGSGYLWPDGMHYSVYFKHH